MSAYVHGSIVTPYGPASNNRGESDGNIVRLQQILWRGEAHTTISAEAIRYALRSQFPQYGLKTNRIRREDPNGHDTPFDWQDGNFTNTKKEGYADDDVLGYMLAKRTEGDSGDNVTVRRTGRLAVNKAISLDPFSFETMFNAASAGASPGATSKKVTAKAAKAAEAGGTAKAAKPSNPAPYSSEVHATRYQFPFSLDVANLNNPKIAPKIVRILSELCQVAGNHSRSSFDFSAESIALRVTDRPCSRLSYCFQHANPEDGDFTVVSPSLVRLVEAGDINPLELFIGGAIADTEDGRKLSDLGVQVYKGVVACVDAVCQKLDQVYGV